MIINWWFYKNQKGCYIMNNQFTPEVIKELKYYVYLLIDPTSNKPFYVGKGQGNRIFSHVQSVIGSTNDPNEDKKNKTETNKNNIIKNILASGQQIVHQIVRYGIDDETEAFHIESALIDVLGAQHELTNAVRGHESNYATAQQVQANLGNPIKQFNHSVLLIKIKESTVNARDGVYNAVRWSWRIDRIKAKKYDYVLAVVNGIVEGIFTVKEWYPATIEYLEKLPKNENPFKSKVEANDMSDGRSFFTGEQVTDKTITDLYLNKLVPKEYRKANTQSPIRYYKI